LRGKRAGACRDDEGGEFGCGKHESFP
jgi:hypothetical protein